jgi:hypothetical protein
VVLRLSTKAFRFPVEDAGVSWRVALGELSGLVFFHASVREREGVGVGSMSSIDKEESLAMGRAARDTACLSGTILSWERVRRC